MPVAATLTPPPATTASRSVPLWLRGWSVLTALAALPLLLLGAEVTTKQVGMVDPEGLRLPWHIWLVSLQDRGLGYLIEHSHRLAGWVVGACVIVLTLGLALAQSRRWLRWLGVAVLAAIVFQGVLGILRVQLNALFGRNLALFHGCFAQLVFALLVATAYLTLAASSARNHFGVEPSVRWLALVTAGLVYLQIVFGALVRHTESVIAPRVHLLVAFVIVSAVAVLWVRGREQSLGRLVNVQAGLLALQLLLGIESWMSKFVNPGWRQLAPLTAYSDLARSLHLLVGSLLFATSVVVALRTSVVPRLGSSRDGVGRLEVAA